MCSQTVAHQWPIMLLQIACDRNLQCLMLPTALARTLKFLQVDRTLVVFLD